MRYESFIKNEYYRITGRGSGQSELFLDDTDRARFLFLLTHFQSPIRVYNVTWYTTSFLKKGYFSTGENRIKEILKKRSVELISFAILADHFDIIIKNLEDQILSVYMHRILTAYGKYFNKKYKKTGHVFAGPFEATRIKPSELSSTTTEIHKKPVNYAEYPWSSHRDYAKKNRWGDLLILPKAPQK